MINGRNSGRDLSFVHENNVDLVVMGTVAKGCFGPSFDWSRERPEQLVSRIGSGVRGLAETTDVHCSSRIDR